MLFEGAQGAMLDIDHGTYPFVTSSNPIAGAACVGAGVGPARHRRDLGRLQGLHDARRRRARSRPSSTTSSARSSAALGGEFGTTTGRPRRTGWLDLVALRYAARLNTLSALAITKLDVLSGFDRILVCTGYRGEEGATFDHFPYHQSVLHHAVGEYTELEGWIEDIGECRDGVRPAGGGARLPRLHRRLHRRAGDAGRRRRRPRADDLDRGGRRRRSSLRPPRRRRSRRRSARPASPSP